MTFGFGAGLFEKDGTARFGLAGRRPEALIVQYQPPLCLLHAWSEKTGLVSFTRVIDQTPWSVLHDGQSWMG